MLICKDCLEKHFEPAYEKPRHAERPRIRYYVTCNKCGQIGLCTYVCRRSIRVKSRLLYYGDEHALPERRHIE